MIIDTASWNWPQYVVCVLWAISISCNGFLHDRPKSASRHNVGVAIMTVLLSAWVLTSGGFFR